MFLVLFYLTFFSSNQAKGESSRRWNQFEPPPPSLSITQTLSQRTTQCSKAGEGETRDGGRDLIGLGRGAEEGRNKGVGWRSTGERAKGTETVDRPIRLQSWPWLLITQAVVVELEGLILNFFFLVFVFFFPSAILHNIPPVLHPSFVRSLEL